MQLLFLSQMTRVPHCLEADKRPQQSQGGGGALDLDHGETEEPRLWLSTILCHLLRIALERTLNHRHVATAIFSAIVLLNERARSPCQI